MIIPQKIVIAGAGIIGNSIAYYLTRNHPEMLYKYGGKFTVTVIDPVGLCPGASSKAGGLLAQKWRDGTEQEELHRLGFDLHQELATDLGAEKIDYRRLICTSAAIYDGKGGTPGKHSSKKLSALEWVDNVSTVSDDDDDIGDDTEVLYSTSMGDESDMAQVHPKKLCEEMWEYSSSVGGMELQIGKVIGVSLSESSNPQRVTSVTLEDGTSVEADILVVAAGPWTEEMRNWFDTAEGNASVSALPQIIGTKSHSMLIRTEDGRVLTEAVFFESNDPFINDIEVYPRPDGDIYVTGSSQSYTVMTERPGAEAVDPKRVKELTESMRKTSPKVLGGLKPHTTQACYWPETSDGIPVIDQLPGLEGVYVATGHNVWGILQGPATGAVMAKLLVDGEQKIIDLDPFRMSKVKVGNSEF